MRAIFALVVLVGCSYAMPQELGAAATPVIVVDQAAAETPAAATNVEPAPADASATQDVNRQGIAAGIAATSGAAGGVAAGAGGAAGAAGAARNPNPYGAAFYGPGLNNPTAIAPLQQHIKTAQQIAAANPNLRVRVHGDGTILFTDQYGQEIEVVDQFGLEPFEPIDPVEHQEFFLIDAQQKARLEIANIYRKHGLSADGATLLPGAGAGFGAAGAGAAGAGAGAGAAGGLGGPLGNLQRRFSVLVA